MCPSIHGFWVQRGGGVGQHPPPMKGSPQRPEVAGQSDVRTVLQRSLSWLKGRQFCPLEKEGFQAWLVAVSRRLALVRDNERVSSAPYNLSLWLGWRKHWALSESIRVFQMPLAFYFSFIFPILHIHTPASFQVWPLPLSVILAAVFVIRYTPTFWHTYKKTKKTESGNSWKAPHHL